MKIFDFALPDLSPEGFIKEVCFILFTILTGLLFYFLMFSPYSPLQIGAILFLMIGLVKVVQNTNKKYK